MKTLILANVALFTLVTGLLCASPYGSNSVIDSMKDRQRQFNNDWDRMENRMQAQEANRIQREQLREMQRQNSYRYGR